MAELAICNLVQSQRSHIHIWNCVVKLGNTVSTGNEFRQGNEERWLSSDLYSLLMVMTYVPSSVQRSTSRASLYSLVCGSNEIHSNGKYYYASSSFHTFIMCFLLFLYIHYVVCLSLFARFSKFSHWFHPYSVPWWNIKIEHTYLKKKSVYNVKGKKNVLINYATMVSEIVVGIGVTSVHNCPIIERNATPMKFWMWDLRF